MNRLELNEEYFEWMCQLVRDRRHCIVKSYKKLLRHLHEIDFFYSIPMDGNREGDGISLRYLFGYENGYEDSTVAAYIDNRSCSVLEMMIALAVRCEVHIMSDPNIGDRTSQWFWGMIDSLGLEYMDDSRFDEAYTDDVIFSFMEHKYARDGRGGLFTIKNSPRDLRNVEIWWQMNWYLNTIVEKGANEDG